MISFIRKGKTEYIFYLLIIAALATGAYYRNEIWGSEISLWKDAVRKSPNKPRPTINISAALAQQGRFEEAKHEIRRFLEVHPESVEAENNLGAILSLQGKYDEALYHVFEALRIDPKNAIAHNNAGAILTRQGKYGEALIHFQEAIKSKPNFEDARKNFDALSRALEKAKQKTNKGGKTNG